MKNISCCVISSEFPNFCIKAFLNKDFPNYPDEGICNLSFNEFSNLIHELGLVEEEKKEYIKSYCKDYGYDLVDFYKKQSDLDK